MRMEAASEVSELPMVDTSSPDHNSVKPRLRKTAKDEGGACVAALVTACSRCGARAASRFTRRSAHGRAVEHHDPPAAGDNPASAAPLSQYLGGGLARGADALRQLFLRNGHIAARAFGAVEFQQRARQARRRIEK